MAQRWLCKCDNISNQIVSHCPLKGGEAGPEHVQHRPHTSSKAGQVSAAAVARILLILDLVVRKGRRGVVRDREGANVVCVPRRFGKTCADCVHL